MPRSLALVSVACGLLLSTHAFAAGVHVQSSSSTHVSTDENGNVTRTEDSRTTESYTDDTGAQLHITTTTNAEADTPRLGSYRTIHNRKGTNSASVHLRSTMRKTSNGVQMRLARRVCMKLGAEDKEQCMSDAAEGSVSAVREKLRMWLKSFNN